MKEHENPKTNNRNTTSTKFTLKEKYGLPIMSKKRTIQNRQQPGNLLYQLWTDNRQPISI